MAVSILDKRRQGRYASHKVEIVSNTLRFGRYQNYHLIEEKVV